MPTCRKTADSSHQNLTTLVVRGPHLAAAGLKSGIMYRASRGHPLGARQKQFNRLVARRRWVVEQAFGTLKRRFRGARSRYLTCRNVEAELTLKATVMNLLKAANRIDLVAA